MVRTAFLVIGALVAAHAVAQDLFIDKGACPGEGCVYGERWVAGTPVRLQSAPSSMASSSGNVLGGETVQTITGKVHTIPRAVVHGHPVDGARAYWALWTTARGTAMDL